MSILELLRLKPSIDPDQTCANPLSPSPEFDMGEKGEIFSCRNKWSLLIIISFWGKNEKITV